MKIPFDNLAEHGIIKDVPDYELPYNAWSDGQNVRFDDGKAIKFKGHAAVYDPPTVAPYHLFPLETATNFYFLYPSLTKCYVHDGTTHTNITRQSGGVDVDYAADADIGWNGGSLNGSMVINNGVDDPQYWPLPVSTSTKLTSLVWDGTPSTWSSKGYTATVIRPFKNFLVALDFNDGSTRYPRQVRWSDAAPAGAIPASWDDTDATTLAGFTTELEATDGFCIDCLPQRNTNIVYKSDSTWSMALTGGSDVFAFRQIFGQVGLLAHNCVTEFEGIHVALTIGPDLIMHDGQQATSLLDKKWQKWLQSNISSTAYQRSFVVQYQARNEIWACFPSTDNSFCNKALVWNWKTGAIGQRDLPQVAYIAPGLVDDSTPATWATVTGTWASIDQIWDEYLFNPTAKQLLMAGTNDTKLYNADNTNQFAGSNMTSYIERTGLAVVGVDRRGSPTVDMEAIKSCTAVYPKISATNGTVVSVYVGSQAQIGDSIAWSGPHSFTVGTDYKVDVRVTGKLLGVRFESKTDVAWGISSYDMDIELAGGR